METLYYFYNNFYKYLKKKFNNFYQIRISFLKLYLIFSLFIILVNFIYCFLYIQKFPEIVDSKNNYILENIGFNFGQVMKNLMDYNLLKAVYFDIDFYTSRMPLLPYFLKFLFNYFSHNFYIIHLIKNLFFFINYFSSRY